VLTVSLLFLATCDNDKRILQYGAAIILYIWLVTAVCLYTETLLAFYRVLEKCLWSPGKVLEFFVTKRVGTLLLVLIMSCYAYARPIGGPEGITLLGCPSVCACVCTNMC